mmetsp:Transcript_5586/g.21035  ORF Transcript_5586/g.21035 Transcript_5586/m.21035 type:complete len:287 (-) Transcript_5586:1051-1911(-)
MWSSSLCPVNASSRSSGDSATSPTPLATFRTHDRSSPSSSGTGSQHGHVPVGVPPAHTNARAPGSFCRKYVCEKSVPAPSRPTQPGDPPAEEEATPDDGLFPAPPPPSPSPRPPGRWTRARHQPIASIASARLRALLYTMCTATTPPPTPPTPGARLTTPARVSHVPFLPLPSIEAGAFVDRIDRRCASARGASATVLTHPRPKSQSGAPAASSLPSEEPSAANAMSVLRRSAAIASHVVRACGHSSPAPSPSLPFPAYTSPLKPLATFHPLPSLTRSLTASRNRG